MPSLLALKLEFLHSARKKQSQGVKTARFSTPPAMCPCSSRIGAALHLVRAYPKCDDVTLIALAGWGQENDRRRSEAAGFDYHLTKPADISALEALLVSLHSREYSP
jgi:hypothetical protein